MSSKSGLPQGEAYRDVKSRAKKLRQGDNLGISNWFPPSEDFRSRGVGQVRATVGYQTDPALPPSYLLHDPAQPLVPSEAQRKEAPPRNGGVRDTLAPIYSRPAWLCASYR